MLGKEPPQRTDEKNGNTSLWGCSMISGLSTEWQRKAKALPRIVIAT